MEEIRAIRRRLWEAAGRDINRYIRQTQVAADLLRPPSDEMSPRVPTLRAKP